jgi:hypothetical protein
MQKYKQAAISIAVVTLILTSGLYSGTKPAEKKGTENNTDPSQEELLETFENNDFETWSRLVSSRGAIARVVTKEDFDTFVEARQAARGGDYDKAIELSSFLEMELKSKLSDIFV